jgi:hypothetical protein
MSRTFDPTPDTNPAPSDTPTPGNAPVLGEGSAVGLDVIGDVHGEHRKLEALLGRLGYLRTGGSWAHPERLAVFVGDLIDRGPEQVRTVQTVRSMVESGAAKIVMGNHEFNALGWMTKNPAVEGDTLRQRLGGKGAVHRSQHQTFLDEVGEGSPLHWEILDWFRTIPLHLDLGAARVVHACWDDPSIDLLSRSVAPDRVLDEELLVALYDKSQPLGLALETVVKGPEFRLGDDLAYLDKDGNPRRKARYAWWATPGCSMRDALVLPGGSRCIDGSPHPGFPQDPLTVAPVQPYRSSVPVFFGHYWFTGVPSPKSAVIAGVDYSAAKGGPLVAYRFDGEAILDPAKFVASS